MLTQPTTPSSIVDGSGGCVVLDSSADSTADSISLVTTDSQPVPGESPARDGAAQGQPREGGRGAQKYAPASAGWL